MWGSAKVIVLAGALGCGGVVRSVPDAAMRDAEPVEIEPDAGEPDVDNGPPRTLTILASGQKVPYTLTMDATHLYWTNGAAGTVIKCPKSGGKLIVLASGQKMPMGITVDAKTAYWTTAGSWGLPGELPLAKCATAGCDGKPGLVSKQHARFAIGMEGASLFYHAAGTVSMGGVWIEYSGIMKCPTAGCEPGIELATAEEDVRALIVAAGNVFWTSRPSGRVLRCSTSGCASPTVVAAGQPYPQGLTSDDGAIYWTNQSSPGTVMTCAIGGCNGSPTMLAGGQALPTGIATDGQNVYWANQLGGQIMKCPVSGCAGAPEVLVDQQAYPFAIVVDDKAVYWTNIADFTVRKLEPK